MSYCRQGDVDDPHAFAHEGATIVRRFGMERTYDELKKLTVVKLRELASEMEHEALKGYTQLNKERLIEALCEAHGIETRKKRLVVGLDKAALKTRIRQLKVRRDTALEKRDHDELKSVRRKIHRLKRQIHKATQ